MANTARVWQGFSGTDPEGAVGAPLVTGAGLAIPRGRLAEIYGRGTAGRTTLALSAVAEATRAGEVCAWVDGDDCLDAETAAGAGVKLERLLWVRCGGKVETAVKAADLVLQAGSFGVVVLDIGDSAAGWVRRIPLNYWYRFRRVVEGTRTILLVLGQEATLRQCASVAVETGQAEARWSGKAASSRLLEGVRYRYGVKRPPGGQGGEMLASTGAAVTIIMAE